MHVQNKSGFEPEPLPTTDQSQEKLNGCTCAALLSLPLANLASIYAINSNDMKHDERNHQITSIKMSGFATLICGPVEPWN
jgi:hypothetical protein